MLLRQSVTVLNKEIKISLIWGFPKCVLQSLRVSELAHRGVLGGPWWPILPVSLAPSSCEISRDLGTTILEFVRFFCSPLEGRDWRTIMTQVGLGTIALTDFSRRSQAAN